MIKAGIIGATGYAGQELVRLLQNHPETELSMISSRSYSGESYNEIYPNFTTLNSLRAGTYTVDEMAENCDVVFLALPHGTASNVIKKEHLAEAKIIDLGADFRLKSAETYTKWYKTEHGSPELLDQAVYGLCEINRKEIITAELIANPGCYTTCSILSLAPLVSEGLIESDSIIIDAKSGVSGAGRSLSLGTHFTECNDSIKAYGITTHRHTPEIEQELSIAGGEPLTLSFTPHLVPMNRGILATSYAKLKSDIDATKLSELYRNFYSGSPFIRIFDGDILPETRFVRNSNFFDVGFRIDSRNGRIIVIGAIDNLVKGAAGQAVQNMNLIFGLSETAGLDSVPTVL